MKLQTPVECGRSSVGISYGDRIMVLGSCFADNIGRKLSEAGFEVRVNPFGTLYNPVSLLNAVSRLVHPVPFTEDDCVMMGAGAGLYCSFSHYTSFARKTKAEFLENANGSLSDASSFFSGCNKVIVTLGTAWCFRHNGSGETVSNCLKRPASEFTRYCLGAGETRAVLARLLGACGGKKMVMTVSPIRHLADSAHGNQLSKSILLLAVDSVCATSRGCAEYFPAYEIMNDELRDYRFYAEDMVHPSDQAVRYIWERFMDFALPEDEKEKLLENEKLFRQSQHRPMH